MRTVDGSLSVPTETPSQPSAAVAWQTGEEGSVLVVWGSGCLSDLPPSFAPTQLPLAWTEAHAQMEVGAPSSPPGRLPACECLAQCHQWALHGEICPLPLLLESPGECWYHFLHVCGLGNVLCFPIGNQDRVKSGGSEVYLAWVQIPHHVAKWLRLKPVKSRYSGMEN